MSARHPAERIDEPGEDESGREIFSDVSDLPTADDVNDVAARGDGGQHEGASALRQKTAVERVADSPFRLRADRLFDLRQLRGVRGLLKASLARLEKPKGRRISH